MIELAGLATNLAASGYIVVRSFTLAGLWARTCYFGFCCGPYPKELQSLLGWLLLLGFAGGCIAAKNPTFLRISRFALLVSFGVWGVTWFWMRGYLSWLFH